MQFDSRLTAPPEQPDPTRLYFPHGGGQTEGSPIGEDCLSLNVWSPATGPDERLPVMVWFHGGSYRAGSGAATLTVGDALAATGRVVVVTVNHRLGALGFFALDHLLGEEYRGSGLLGLTDMVLALEWVRDNIAAFGGDPDRVTAFGQSGGGGKVAALLRMPSAAGLFQRCIVQSPGGSPLDPESGVRQTEAMLKAIGATDARELESLPVGRFVEGQGRLADLGPWPVADGELLLAVDDESTAALADGVPILIGTTTHEWSLMVAGSPWYATLDEASLAAALESASPGIDGAGTSAEYRERHPEDSVPLRFSRIMADRFFGAEVDSIVAARASRDALYRYEFAYQSDAEPGPLGATHCIDVPCVFGTVRWTPLVGDRPERWGLERRVMETWISFAENGMPGDGWPCAGTATADTVRIDAGEWRIVPAPTAAAYG
jgi:para-nitrobenzyl esterase